MDQQRTPLRAQFGDMDLDDAPGLTARDEASLDAIRRQLQEEYVDADAPPSPPDENPALPAAPGVRAGRWPLVAGLVSLAAVGGGAVGAMLTAHMLGRPDTTVASRERPEPSHERPEPSHERPDPVVAMRSGVVSAIPSQTYAATTRAPVTPGADHARPELPPSPRSRSAPATREPLTPLVTVEKSMKAGRPDVSAPESIAASPIARSDAASRPSSSPPASAPTRPSSSPPASSGPTATSPIAGPEPQTWSDPFQPLNAETAAHTGVAQAAFRSSRASPVPPPAPPPTGPPLPTPRTAPIPTAVLPGPEAAPDGAAKQSPDTPRDESLLTTLREDWETVKSGFASAPDDFRRAWRSLSRDLKGLLDR